MGETKHTPGPWAAGRSDMATIVQGYESKWIYADEACIAMATIKDVDDWEVVMANAHLIAAAPDLFAALRELRNAIMNGLCNGGTPAFEGGPERLDQAITAADTALSKVQP